MSDPLGIGLTTKGIAILLAVSGRAQGVDDFNLTLTSKLPTGNKVVVNEEVESLPPTLT